MAALLLGFSIIGAIARARCDLRHKILFFGCLFNVRFTPKEDILAQAANPKSQQLYALKTERSKKV
jgi:hypothetical protein